METNCMVGHEETADIEVMGDEYEERQELLRQMAAEKTMAAEWDTTNPDGTQMSEESYAGIDSCEALRIIDESAYWDDVNAEEQRLIDAESDYRKGIILNDGI